MREGAAEKKGKELENQERAKNRVMENPHPSKIPGVHTNTCVGCLYKPSAKYLCNTRYHTGIQTTGKERTKGSLMPVTNMQEELD